MQSRGNNKKIQMSKYMVYIVLAVVFVFFAITLRDNGFASTQNLLNILRQTAMISIMSVAGVFVLSAGQIDLTVGSNTAMSAMLVALVLKSTNNIFLALIVALIFGVAVGVINGLLVTRLGLPAFLATLGMHGNGDPEVQQCGLQIQRQCRFQIQYLILYSVQDLWDLFLF